MAWESTDNVEPAQIKNNVLNVPPTLTKCPTCSGSRIRSDKDQITIKLPWPQSGTQLTPIHTLETENEIKPRTRSRSNTYWPKPKRTNNRSQFSIPELFVFETLLLKFVISQTAESSSNKCVPLSPLKITALSYWLINKQILPPRNLPKIIFTFLCWVISKDCWQVLLGSKHLQISEKVV